MDKSGRDFGQVIQEFIDIKVRQDSVSGECCEKCLFAFEVSLVKSWVDLPRIVAIIQNEATKQIVIFVFTGTRIADTTVSYLTTNKLIAVDDVLNCEPNPSRPTLLRIIGRDISSPKSDLGNSSTMPPSNRLSQTNGYPHTLQKSRFCTLILDFGDATSAGQFRTVIAHLLARQTNHQWTSSLGTKWLNKYRNDIDQKFDRVISTTTTMAAAGPRFNDRRRQHQHRPRATHSSSDLLREANNDDADGGSDNDAPSTGTSSTTSSLESLHTSPRANSVVDNAIRRSVSVPRLLESEGKASGAVEKGEDALTKSEWLAGDLGAGSSVIDVSAETTSAGATATREEREEVQEVEWKMPADGSPQSPRDNNSRRRNSYGRTAAVSFMPDTTYRARLNADPVVRSMLEQDETAFCAWRTLSLFVGSWNVNGRQDSLLKLDDWIRPPPGQPPADIYVFGFQELDLNLAGMALNKQTPSVYESKWLWLLETSMEKLFLQHRTGRHSVSAGKRTGSIGGGGGGFKRLAIVRLAGLLLVVYVASRLHSHAVVSDIAVQAVPTGMFNLMGNKGSVGVRLTVYNQSICLINCHLAAGSGNCERRNQDYGEIARKMIFERPSSAPMEPGRFLRIGDHDQVFLFGDLNYRLSGLDTTEILNAISRGDYSLLLKFDELLNQQALGRVLEGFSEGKITFAPTYKFDLATNSYYVAEGRVPSYCDRILWKGKYVEQLRYTSHESFRLSDHKPVSACFKIGARYVSQQLFMRAYEAVIRSQDLFYNMLLPQARLSSQEVDLGPVHFEEGRRASLQLTNTGHAGLEFAFAQEGAAAFPPWLHVAPSNARVEKGQSCEIVLDICVGLDVVAAVQDGNSPLSCIIVLTLVGGKDFFISISGRFVPTSVGVPLALLLRLPTTPVATIPPDQLTQMIRETKAGAGEVTAVTKAPGGLNFTVPKEIFRLTDFIAARFDEPDLFRQPELRSDLPVIRDTLDTTNHDVPIPSSVSVHSVIYSLLVFLSALPEPVVPVAFQAQCLAAARQASSASSSASGTTSSASTAGVVACYQAVACMPTHHQNLFFYLVSFIKRCISYRQHNRTSEDMLASTFADLILRDPPQASPRALSNGSSTRSAAAQQRLRQQQQQAAQNRQELKTTFLRVFITSDTEEVIRCLTAPPPLTQSR